MTLLTKTAAAALIAATASTLAGTSGAAPLSASLSLREASTPALRTIQWYGYGDDYDYCPPASYSYYSQRSYGYGYGPAQYYGNGYAPRYYGGYWPGYRPRVYSRPWW
jgi:hypothetical protein